MDSQANSNPASSHRMQEFIGKALRIGVFSACIVGIIGGICYLWMHGMEKIPDYRSFHGEGASYTTARGIWEGIIHFRAKEWIQLGVVLLIFTPIFRVLLSILLFFKEKDWLYVVISTIVLGIILGNMLEGSLG